MPRLGDQGRDIKWISNISSANDNVNTEISFEDWMEEAYGAPAPVFSLADRRERVLQAA